MPTGTGSSRPITSVGFGQSATPSTAEFSYTFDALAEITQGLLDQLDVQRYAMYVQDYGAPIGWRLALRRPRPVTAIITQNGNAHAGGFVPEFWSAVWNYAHDPSPETEPGVRFALTLEAIWWQYLTGVAESDRVDPETWQLDHADLSRPGNDEVQLALFRDYLTNPALYPAVQKYFRTSQVQLLAIRGDGDEVFGPAGARVFACNLPDAETHLISGGHFLLESALDTASNRIRGLLGRVLTAVAA